MRLLFFLSILVTNTCFGQKNLWLEEQDSIQLKIYDNVTKEMTAIGEDEHLNLLVETTLIEKDVNKFVSYFKQAKLFEEPKAQLTHYNIEFILFQGNKKEIFQISSITRTVYHFIEGSSQYDFPASRMISPKIEKFLIKLLKKNSMLHYISEDIRFVK